MLLWQFFLFCLLKSAVYQKNNIKRGDKPSLNTIFSKY
nr:MAG TPA: hypothetical protein [Caudoviricetes sp.]